MQEIIKPKLIEQNMRVYIAEDGTEFENREQCIGYEREKDLKNLSVIEQCRELEYRANCNGAENMESHDYKWYRPKSAEEIELLNKYIGDGISVSEDSIGKWICLEESDSDAWVSTLDEGLEYVKELLNSLGFDITVTERRRGGDINDEAGKSCDSSIAE